MARVEPLLIVAFSGTRDLDTSPGSLGRELLEKEIAALPPHALVMHGNNGNVDWTARDLARARGLTVIEVTANWKQHGRKKAGPIRNSEMAKRKPERWVVVWNGRSPGSADALKKARGCGALITDHRVLAPGEPDPRLGALAR